MDEMNTVEGVWSFVSSSEKETHRFGRWLGEILRHGQTLALDGELGAGKTTLVRGIAEGAEVDDIREVTSPTYSLMNIYGTKTGTLTHIDFYRLQDPEEARLLGLGEQIADPHTVALIEWAGLLPELLPPNHIELHLHWESENERRFEIKGIAKPETFVWSSG